MDSARGFALRKAISVKANRSSISHLPFGGIKRTHRQRRASIPTLITQKMADVCERCRTVAARTQAESDRLAMGCGGVMNSRKRGRTEKNSRMAPRAGFEPATIRLTVECSTAELPRNRRNPARHGQRITKPPGLAKDEIFQFRAASKGRKTARAMGFAVPFGRTKMANSAPQHAIRRPLEPPIAPHSLTARTPPYTHHSGSPSAAAGSW